MNTAAIEAPKLKTSQKIGDTLAYLSLAFVLVSIGYVAYLAFYPFKTVTVDQPYTVQNKKVYPGDILRYNFEYCRHTDGNVHIQHYLHPLVHQLRGETAIRLEQRSVSIEIMDQGLRLRKGCGVASKGITLPENVPPGMYWIEEFLTYDVSRLQTKSITLRTEGFEVVERSRPINDHVSNESQVRW